VKAQHFLAFLAVAALTSAAIAAETHHISQKKRSFSQPEITIAAGDTIEFANDDEFIHQIYVDAANFKVDTAESEPGNMMDVKFTKSGDFEVHCHIHPKMQLLVHVE
jgi:plastocyanin